MELREEFLASMKVADIKRVLRLHGVCEYGLRSQLVVRLETLFNSHNSDLFEFDKKDVENSTHFYAEEGLVKDASTTTTNRVVSMGNLALDKRQTYVIVSGTDSVDRESGAGYGCFVQSDNISNGNRNTDIVSVTTNTVLSKCNIGNSSSVAEYLPERNTPSQCGTEVKKEQLQAHDNEIGGSYKSTINDVAPQAVNIKTERIDDYKAGNLSKTNGNLTVDRGCSPISTELSKSAGATMTYKILTGVIEAALTESLVHLNSKQSHHQLSQNHGTNVSVEKSFAMLPTSSTQQLHSLTAKSCLQAILDVKTEKVDTYRVSQDIAVVPVCDVIAQDSLQSIGLKFGSRPPTVFSYIDANAHYNISTSVVPVECCAPIKAVEILHAEKTIDHLSPSMDIVAVSSLEILRGKKRSGIPKIFLQWKVDTHQMMKDKLAKRRLESDETLQDGEQDLKTTTSSQLKKLKLVEPLASSKKSLIPHCASTMVTSVGGGVVSTCERGVVSTCSSNVQPGKPVLSHPVTSEAVVASVTKSTDCQKASKTVPVYKRCSVSPLVFAEEPAPPGCDMYTGLPLPLETAPAPVYKPTSLPSGAHLVSGGKPLVQPIPHHRYMPTMIPQYSSISYGGQSLWRSSSDECGDW